MLKYLALSLVSLAVSLMVSLLVINSGVLHERMERMIRERTGVPVELGRMRVAFKWPPTIGLRATKIPAGDLNFEFAGAVLVLRSIFEPYDVRLVLNQPVFTAKTPVSGLSFASPAAPGGQSGTAAGARAPAKRFGLSLQIINGAVRTPEFGAENLNFEFDQKLWMKTSARLKMSGRFRGGPVPGEWPVSVQTENLLFSDEAIKATAVQASVAGLTAAMQISSLLKEGRHRLVLDVKAPDLAKVPAPFAIPAKDWRGAVEVFAEVLKEGPDQPWGAEGRATLQSVGAVLDWASGGWAVKGPFQADFKGKFSYVDGQLSLPELTGSLDLTASQVDGHGLVSKPPHTDLKFEIEAGGNSAMTNIKKLSARLWNLQSAVTGNLSLVEPYNAKLEITVPPTSLKGLESVIVPIKASPVQGEMAAHAEFDGPLKDPWRARVDIHSLRLKSFAAQVNYDGGGAIKARGPISATAEIKGEVDQGRPKALDIKGQTQLSGLALVAGPLRKEEKQPLSATFSLTSDGSSVHIRQMSIDGFLGKIALNGRASEPLKPRLQLRVDLNPLDLSELRSALPDQRESLPKGSVSGTLNLVGQILPVNPWADWPLRVTGDLKVILPEYAMAAVPVESTAKAETEESMSGPGAEPVVTGFLPKGELTGDLNLDLGVAIGVLQKEGLTIKGLDARGRIAKGQFTGGATLREIFGGQVQVSQLNVPLLEPLPRLEGQVSYSGLIIQDVLAFLRPELKGLATGRAAGQTTFLTRMPSDSRFLDELSAKGRITLEPVTLNTIRIGELLNDLAKKVPMIKLPPAKLDPLKGVVRSEYALAAQAIDLTSLSARDEDGSELSLKGKVILPGLQGDLVGHFAWAGTQIKGCLLEGNADASGRMVVPLSLKGDLMKPATSLLADTAGKLAGRALECEKSKILEQVKKDGGKKLETEAKKVLKGILGP